MTALIRVFALSLAVLVFASPALVLAQQAEQEKEQETKQENMTVEEILAREPTAEDYGNSERCIRSQRIRSTEVLDEQHIALKMNRDNYYIIQFKHRCPGLRRDQPVIFEPTSGHSLCVLDGIRPTYDSGLGELTPGGRCAIPGFQKVTKEQVSMLKDALKIQQRQQREERAEARRERREAKQLKKAAEKQQEREAQ